MPMSYRSFVCLALIAFAASYPLEARATERIVFYRYAALLPTDPVAHLLQFADLPAGTPEEPLELSSQLSALTYLQDGRLVAVANWELFSVANDGQMSRIGALTRDPEWLASGEEILDLEVGGDGQLYVLSRQSVDTGNAGTRLFQVDPATGATLTNRRLPGPFTFETLPKAMAFSPNGLWVLSRDGIRRLDLTTLTFSVETIPNSASTTEGNPYVDIAADAQGDLWALFEIPCDPGCVGLVRIVPKTGITDSQGVQSPSGTYRIAVARDCVDTTTGFCMQDGHFYTSILWRDQAGQGAVGKTVPIRSADTGIYYFFDPDNWEVVVKVLDGCAINGHYWVFTAATTNVAYELTIYDRLNLSQIKLTNPLGQLAAPAANTTAFRCQ